MFPILIDLGRVDLPLLGETHLFLPSYGALFAGGTLLAWTWFLRRARTFGLPDDDLFNLSFYTLLAGIFGAKLALVLVDWRAYAANPAALLGTLRSAGVLMGGVIAGAAVFLSYSRSKGLPVWRLADAVVAPVALAQAIGRLGCFSAGCCWGVHTGDDNPLAVTFTDPAAREQTGVPLGLPLVPTQLVQFASDLALAGVLTWLWRRGATPQGSVFWWYVVLYGVTRGLIEFWRGDAERGLYFGGSVSTSQLIALVAVALGSAMLLRGHRRA